MSLLLLLNAGIGGITPCDSPGLASSSGDNQLPTTPIVVQAVVTTVGQSEYGKIVQVVGPAWLAILQALQSPNVVVCVEQRCGIWTR